MKIHFILSMETFGTTPAPGRIHAKTRFGRDPKTSLPCTNRLGYVLH